MVVSSTVPAGGFGLSEFTSNACDRTYVGLPGPSDPCRTGTRRSAPAPVERGKDGVMQVLQRLVAANLDGPADHRIGLGKSPGIPAGDDAHVKGIERGNARLRPSGLSLRATSPPMRVSAPGTFAFDVSWQAQDQVTMRETDGTGGNAQSDETRAGGRDYCRSLGQSSLSSRDSERSASTTPSRSGTLGSSWFRSRRSGSAGPSRADRARLPELAVHGEVGTKGRDIP